MIFGNKIIKYRDEIIQSLTELVAIESVRGEAEPGKPFGKNSAEALKLILSMAAQMGLVTKNVGNYAGHAEYGSGNEIAAVTTHVDVVPAGEGWETDPFRLTKKGSLCFGRGTADDKGAAIVSLYCLKVLKDENVIGKRRLRTIFGAGEETGMEDLQEYFRTEPIPDMGFTPDSEYGICNREKGILHVSFHQNGNDSKAVRQFHAGEVYNAVPSKAYAVLSCEPDRVSELEQEADRLKGNFRFEKISGGVKITSIGKASHAMQPQEGLNAASYLIRLLASVFPPEELGTFLDYFNRRINIEYDGQSMGVKQSDDESGPLTLNLGLVRIEESNCYAGIDIRYPVTANGEQIYDIIRSGAEKAGVTTKCESHSKPLFLPESSTLISLLKDSYQAVTGQPASVYSTGGGTYARAMRGKAVAFGALFPDEPDRRLHNTGEHIDMDRFMVHAQICLEAMYRMLTL